MKILKLRGHPAKKEVDTFWSEIWGPSLDHTKGHKWSNRVKDNYYVDISKKHYQVSTAKVIEV